MPEPNPAAMEFLLSRRSRPAKTLRPPAPDDATLRRILTAAARSPDHGKLEPWRFIVLRGAALERLAALVERLGPELGRGPEEVAKARAQFADPPLCVAVIEVHKPSDKVPPIEQSYSAGAVCLGLLNAALAAGFGANWLTGWPVYAPRFLTEGLGLAENERVAGLIHIGTETAAPPERPRPRLEAITQWLSE
ncbi:MAG: nitroreductase [Roseovarius sp.]